MGKEMGKKQLNENYSIISITFGGQPFRQQTPDVQASSARGEGLET